MSAEIVFYVNGSRVALRDPDPALLLIDHLRASGLTGTKLSCGEGGCGACTVMIASWDSVGARVVRRSVNACLRPVASIDGMAVTTVEGIGNTRAGLNPVQRRLAAGNGSQCGYCSPGFVMTAYAHLREHERPSEQSIEDLFAGNLCRCTGYRPILDAMRSFARPPYADDVAADTFPAELRDRPLRPCASAAAPHLVSPHHARAGAEPQGPALARPERPEARGGQHVDRHLQGRRPARADRPRGRRGAAARRAERGRRGARGRRGVTYTPAARRPGRATGLAALDALVARIAGTQVRDEATVGGAISLLWQHAAGPSRFRRTSTRHSRAWTRRSSSRHVRGGRRVVRRARIARGRCVAARRRRRDRPRAALAGRRARRDLSCRATRAERPRARQRVPVRAAGRRGPRRDRPAGVRRDRRAAGARRRGGAGAGRPAVGRGGADHCARSAAHRARAGDHRLARRHLAQRSARPRGVALLPVLPRRRRSAGARQRSRRSSPAGRTRRRARCRPATTTSSTRTRFPSSPRRARRRARRSTRRTPATRRAPSSARSSRARTAMRASRTRAAWTRCCRPCRSASRACSPT